ncbi:precorrin-2 C20-methyltransferase [Desulfitobacterium dichloroeliminans LMG P-21439]|uniref:Precorrin-2 C20-methyltransferase n=1 Tax=Desulfitobacterium dichloroeliminans (strain LMG P-21439 / DCA1) TaxID=871963 RepID=L0F5U6_DESDL|nr:precorrin-2 C(20)-methyltransferase [Desulfitobacterium dichloroeliminans]AGA68537.1 precorrin-2 C20-methyltransferase [Desulfitobacterium dichloroeliminans LMG P-21439]
MQQEQNERTIPQSTRKAKLYGVGVGPGDPSLITLRAVEILQGMQVIAIPKSKMERESVAWEIAQAHCPSGVRILELEMPMTADKEILQAAWHQAAVKIKAELDLGHSVAFLTLGDPSLYSTYSYLLAILKSQLEPDQIETIPGITAMSAAAARVNWPLAIGDDPLIVLPGIEGLEEYEQYPNLVLMKVSRNLPDVLNHIQKTGAQAVLATRVSQTGEEIRLLSPGEVIEKVDYLSLVLYKKDRSEDLG